MRAIGREESMEIRDQYQHGISISALSRETGHDRKTIHDIVTAAAPRMEGGAPRNPQLRLLTPYAEYIRQRIHEGCWNSAVLLDELRAQGYRGGRTLVKDFLAPLRPAKTVTPVMRYETPPGRQAQCDWAAFGETEAPDGTVQKLWAFAYTLSYSRCLYVEFVRDTTQDTLLACLEQAFAYFGAVPEQILSDNMSPMVVRHPRGGPVTWHPRFLDFARFHGFSPRAAEAYRAQTKGKIERPIRYVRGNFWPRLRTVEDLDDLNRQVRHWVATVADARVHQTTWCPPASRRAEDVAAMTPWPADHLFAYGERRPRLVNQEGYVHWAGHAWRVPPAYVGQSVLVQRTREGGCVILVGDTVVARHGRPTDPHQVMTGEIPAVTGPPPPTSRPSRSGRLVLTGPQVQRRSLAQYAAVVE